MHVGDVCSLSMTRRKTFFSIFWGGFFGRDVQMVMYTSMSQGLGSQTLEERDKVEIHIISNLEFTFFALSVWRFIV